MGFKSGYHTYQVETRAVTFTNSDSFINVTWETAFEVPPVVTLMHSGSLGDDDSHQNFHVEAVSKTGCTIQSSIGTNTSVHIQAISAR